MRPFFAIGPRALQRPRLARPSVRLATPADAPLLSTFRSGRQYHYQIEVEDFIQGVGGGPSALGYLIGLSHLDYRLLLFERPRDGLIAVAAHHRIPVQTRDGYPTYLMVFALATPAQRTDVDAEVPTVEGPSRRLSCYVFASVIADALGRSDRSGTVIAKVDPENGPSLTLCGRMGMAFEDRDGQYLRLRGVYR